MRYTQAEKLEIIRLVEALEPPVRQTLAELDVPRSTFYRWYERYRTAGYAGLADQKAGPHQIWDRIPDAVRDHWWKCRLERLGIQRREKAPEGAVRRGAVRQFENVCSQSCFAWPKLSASTQLSAPAIMAHTVIIMISIGEWSHRPSTRGSGKS
jgi:hypothetical protein